MDMARETIIQIYATPSFAGRGWHHFDKEIR